MRCPFCKIPDEQQMAGNDRALAVRDAVPVSPGHTLVVPRRHVERWGDLTAAERAAMFDLAERVMAELDAFGVRPDGYNLGVNLGAAAGQTVPHLALHVIPRHRDDLDDPRGGVRYVIPSRGNPWHERGPGLVFGGAEDPFLPVVRAYLARATDVAVVTPRVLDDGLDLLEDDLRRAWARGTRLRMLVGAEPNREQRRALLRLVDWEAAGVIHEADGRGGRRLAVRLVPADEDAAATFRACVWRFEGPEVAAVFVGSSDLSQAGLVGSVSWNLRVDRQTDPDTYGRAVAEFERWWSRGEPLAAEGVARFPLAIPPGGPVPCPDAPAGSPDEEEAPFVQPLVTALARARTEGRGRVLVLLPPGLDPFAAFAKDALAVARSSGRPPRMLVVAHRVVRLEQAARALRRRLPDLRTSWLLAPRLDPETDVMLGVFDRVTALAARGRFHGTRFDVVVLDEVDRAAAEDLRRLLARLDSDLAVGVGSALDRFVEAERAGVFDDHVAFAVDLQEGVAAGVLAPVVYVGLGDPLCADVTTSGTPQRAVEPEDVDREGARLDRVWDAWRDYPARRTLVVCGSDGRAAAAARWLAARGVSVAVERGTGRGPLHPTMFEALDETALDAVCLSALPDDGTSVPVVDRLVLLDPELSGPDLLEIVGQGLARAAGRDPVTVLDLLAPRFRALDRVRALAGLGRERVTLRDLLARGEWRAPGWSVRLTDDARTALLGLLPRSGGPHDESYAELRIALGRRPSAGSLFRLGFQPAALRAPHGGWFDFLAASGDLDAAEQRALASAREWLHEVETFPTPRGLELVVLDTLLDTGAFPGGLAVAELVARCEERIRRQPELRGDLAVFSTGRGRRSAEPSSAVETWRAGPLGTWSARGWFRELDGRFVFRSTAAGAHRAALVAMTRELLDLRLAELEARRRGAGTGSAFECDVIARRGTVILRLPSASQRPADVAGEIDARIDDGSVWRFRFGTEACQVAWPIGKAKNMLPDLVRRWFGDMREHGDRHRRVRFERCAAGWRATPGTGIPASLRARSWVPCFSSLDEVVAGVGTEPPSRPGAGRVQLPLTDAEADCVALRITGVPPAVDTAEPLREGDVLLLRRTVAVDRPEALAGRIVLLDLGTSGGCRLVRLEQQRPGGTTASGGQDDGAATKGGRVVAVVERVVPAADVHAG